MENMENSAENKKRIFKPAIITIVSVIAAFCMLVIIRTGIYKQTKSAQNITAEEFAELEKLLKIKYPNRYKLITSLPYQLASPELNVLAESAILIDVSNGNVIYEKNPDEVIPPASMTKLFSMYIVDQEVAAGNLKYEDYIKLPPECWACNMPPHSSLMFLGEDQKVTLEELLLGLSICSGNDAAYALAYAVCGSMEAFVARMNQVALDLGLVNTHFVESSGYSEENTTTAREMAAFARVYLMQHPDSLQRFHSVKSFTYPKERNMAPGDYVHSQDWSKGLPRHITMSITQENTNPLLGLLEGCDGLKTGYIDESGYNLTLTAKRDNTRYLSVTMKGPGTNAKEGQQGRINDGLELMEYAFAAFKDKDISEYNKPYFIRDYGTKQRAINLVPSFDFNIQTIPFISGTSLEESLNKVKVEVSVPRYLFGQVEQGQEVGVIKVTLDGYTLDSIPLVADRSTKKANFISVMADRMITK